MRPSSLAHSLLAALLLSPGCYLHHERGEAGGFDDARGPQAEDSAVLAVSPSTPPPAECIERVRDVDLRGLPVDMLFVVDNSGSMREEQAALRAQFPQLIRVLTTGDRDGDGAQDFPPAGDLHLGVVSSDMGLVGITGIPNCEGLGDDGILQNIPGRDAAGCQMSYPRFLSYTAGADSPEQVPTDFSCIADLGTDGCGFEQQLESALKALWPENYVDPRTGERADNPIDFLGDIHGFGQSGHGDGVNAGFLRNDAAGEQSLMAIIVVSDEEDCSSADTRHFTPEAFLPDGDPLREQDLNLRCFFNPENLYPLARYVNGFRALRAGAEYLVFFAAIVGVPPDLVDADARARVDFHDPASRDRHYQAILDDPRMEERPDPNRTPEQGNLVPSCKTPSGKAYPPRRFVELARQLGDNTVVQSICQEDFRPAVEAILGRLGETISVATCATRGR